MKKIHVTFLLASLSMVSVSCLDDETAPLDPSGTRNVIEFLDPSVPTSPTAAVYPVYGSSLVTAPERELELTISFSGAHGNDKNISVKIEVDPGALTLYNTQMTDGLNGKAPLNGSTYELMPAENYALGTTELTIPAGNTKTRFTFKVFPEKFDFSKSYAIPLRISNASHGELSAKFSVAILAIGARNTYDGLYRVTGTLDGHPSVGGPIDRPNHEVTTVNVNTVAFYAPYGVGAASAYFTGVQVFATIADDGKVTLAAGPGSAEIEMQDVDYNRYDADEKKFYLRFGWGAREEDIVLTYKSSR